MWAWQGEGVDRQAYLAAVAAARPGDVCSVFTPDDTHFEIILAALERGLHVMATKPMVKTLAQHQQLVEKAREKNVLLQIEVHKRFDPIYNDARQVYAISIIHRLRFVCMFIHLSSLCHIIFISCFFVM